jgi:hypothetical protein
MTEPSMVCRDHKWNHHVEISADGWADDVRLSDIEPNFTCTRCGKRGADAVGFLGREDYHCFP